MKKSVALTSVILGLFLFGSTLFAQNEDQITTVEEYDSALPFWGTTWSPGSTAISRYYPSFYTGFVMRSQFPERIHIRTSRGNQTRVSVILDDQTLSDYLFDLAKRYQVYKQFTTSGSKPLIKIPDVKNALPQLDWFFQIIESPAYNILQTVEAVESQRISNEQLYAKALDTLEKLNPGRIHRLNIDLAQEFARWNQDILQMLNGQNPAGVFTSKSSQTVIALNTLVFGRINTTDAPSEEVLEQLINTAELIQSGAGDQAILDSSLTLFKMVTGSKYDFLVLADSGGFESPLQCESLNDCRLSYPEFTTIYPTGSAKAWMNDDFGNRITSYATPGLWEFLAYPNRDFDNIRKEAYYGWAPKMDFEGIGNGFHNPAVTFWGMSNSLKQSLGSPAAHSALSAVKRGAVSHGCLRFPVGAVWELRQIMPVQNSVATQVKFFGNNSKDFDLYDVEGDGRIEVMGVEYMISYSTKGASGLSSREGDTIEVSKDQKLEFYTDLYGRKNVFNLEGDKFVFESPSISFPSYLDFKKKSVKTRLKLDGKYPLYEPAYTKDKVQFYAPISTAGLLEFSQQSLSKQIVRLMGRVRGCAPTSDKVQCGEEAFDQEANKIWNRAY